MYSQKYLTWTRMSYCGTTNMQHGSVQFGLNFDFIKSQTQDHGNEVENQTQQ